MEQGTTNDVTMIEQKLSVPKVGNEVVIEVLSEDPRVEFAHNFLSAIKAQQMIDSFERDGRFEPSKVGHDVRDAKTSDVRTSSTVFLKRAETELILQIETKISEFLGVPVENIEPLQVLRYAPGQKFEPHYDFLKKQDAYSRVAGDRQFTCIVYLSEPALDDAGGATCFPELGIKVRPKKGAALIWSNLKSDGSPDYQTLHAGEAPTRGNKYALVGWVREGEFPLNMQIDNTPTAHTVAAREVAVLLVKAFGRFAKPENSPLFTKDYLEQAERCAVQFGKYVDGKLVGYCHIQRHTGSALCLTQDKDHPSFDEIEDFNMMIGLAVDPDHQKQGIARELLRQAEKYVQNNIELPRELRAKVAIRHAPGSVKLMQEMGFTPYYATTEQEWGPTVYYRKQVD